MRFEFNSVTRIIFGTGVLSDVGAAAAKLGKRTLVVMGRGDEQANPLTDVLDKHGVEWVVFNVLHEPSVESIKAGAQKARESGCDLIISFGGGAAVDTGKAVSVLLTNPGEPLDYLEVVGRGQALTIAAAPHIAIPTTAGTGAEVTMNAVIASPEHQVKVSLRSPLMLPKIALVDPALTYTVPPAISARTGLDALTQVIEPFVSNKANPMTDALTREGMMRGARSLRRVYTHPEDAAAREDMSICSLFSGLSLANAKLGAVHGFAGVFGGMFDAPHGAVCAALLPPVMAINVQALRERAPESEALKRYDEVAQLLTGNSSAVAADGVTWVAETAAALDIPKLSAYGLTRDQFPTVIEKSAVASSMQGNPIKLTNDEMAEILTAAL